VPTDDLDIPLFLRFTALADHSGPIRSAIVHGALAQLPGASEENQLWLSSYLAGRRQITVILDGLDEAPQIPADRIRLATMVPGWRCVMTTRRRSWRGQVPIRRDNPREEIFTLDPFTYPHDVTEFVASWFSENPEACGQLMDLIHTRNDIRDMATTPILCALVCLAFEDGGEISQSRRAILRVAIRRLLSGPWREPPDAVDRWGPLERQVRDWAFEAAHEDPISGVGRWPAIVDVAPLDHSLVGSAREAISNVIPENGPADPIRATQPRRFIHRTIREHLVAEALAELPVDKTATLVHKHLWFDDDWKETAALAIAYHPQRESLLREVFRLCGSDATEQGLAELEVNTEIRQLLCAVAAETSEGQWPSLGSLIQLARVQAASILTLSSALQWAVLALGHWSDPADLLAETISTRLFTIGFLRESDITILVNSLLSLQPHRRAEIANWLFARGKQFHLVRALNYLRALPRCAPLDPVLRQETIAWLCERLLSEPGGRGSEMVQLLDALTEDRNWRPSIYGQLASMLSKVGAGALPMETIHLLFEDAPSEWKSLILKTIPEALGVSLRSVDFQVSRVDKELLVRDRDRLMRDALAGVPGPDTAAAISLALRAGATDSEVKALRTRWLEALSNLPLREISSLFIAPYLSRRLESLLTNEDRAIAREIILVRILDGQSYERSNAVTFYCSLHDPDDLVAADLARARHRTDGIRYSPGTLFVMDQAHHSETWAKMSSQLLLSLLHGSLRERSMVWDELPVFVGDASWRSAARTRCIELLDEYDSPQAGHVLSLFEPTADERRKALDRLTEIVPTWPDYEWAHGLALIQEFRNPGDDLARFAPLYGGLTHHEADRVSHTIRTGSTWQAWLPLARHVPPIHLDGASRI
jgi:hypothetical protein